MPCSASRAAISPSVSGLNAGEADTIWQNLFLDGQRGIEEQVESDDFAGRKLNILFADRAGYGGLVHRQHCRDLFLRHGL